MVIKADVMWNELNLPNKSHQTEQGSAGSAHFFTVKLVLPSLFSELSTGCSCTTIWNGEV
jgi:hypothetical protein